MNLDEKRTSERMNVEVPVYIGEERLLTRDVSQSGIFFLSDHLFIKGQDLIFSLVLERAFPGELVKLNCQGEVVRVEQHDSKFGIAANIKKLQFVH